MWTATGLSRAYGGAFHLAPGRFCFVRSDVRLVQQHYVYVMRGLCHRTRTRRVGALLGTHRVTSMLVGCATQGIARSALHRAGAQVAQRQRDSRNNDARIAMRVEQELASLGCPSVPEG